MNFLSICRSCLNESLDLKSIFELCYKSDLESSYSGIIRSLTNLEIIVGDGLPDKLCTSCIEDLVRSQKFIDKFKKSDSILRGYKIDVLKDEIKAEEIIIKDIEVYNDDFKSSSEEDDASLASRLDIFTDDDNDLKNDGNDHQYSKLDVKENTKTNKCDKCDVKFETKTELTKHKKTHGINVRQLEDNCSSDEDNNFDEKDDDNDHKSKDKSVSFTCDTCDLKLGTKTELTKHKKTHSLDLQHACPHATCNKIFSKITHLKVHLRSHLTNEEKPFGCTECGMHYMFKFQLTQHMYKHSDKKPFPCSVCGKGCLTKLSLKRHKQVHDSDYKKSEHICKICEKVFPFPSFLAEHMKNHTGERPFLCSVCGKGFRQRGALQYHLRSHTGFKPYECDICKNTFVSQGVLKVHMRRHTNERPYVCEICGRAFRQSTDMKSHLRLHYGDKRVQCSVCDKRMSSTGQLTVHMRVHTGEKPFPCSVCKKSFATRTMVVKHMRVHSGEKPYSCEICEKSFSQSSSLNTHKKLHNRVQDKTEEKL